MKNRSSLRLTVSFTYDNKILAALIPYSTKGMSCMASQKVIESQLLNVLQKRNLGNQGEWMFGDVHDH